MKTIFFTDLDDSLFSTSRKQVPTNLFTLATTLKDGSPSAYQSPTQQNFLKLWQDNSLIIPVTARNHDAYSRVQVGFHSYAIINHGGVILNPDGSLLQQWHDQQLENSKKSTGWLQKQLENLINIAKELNADIRIKINTDHDLNLYVLLKSNTSDDTMVANIAEVYQTNHSDELTDHGYIHVNSNNLAILPNWLGKQFALNFLKKRLKTELGELLTIGCGDSISDIGFMNACDFWITPKDSQIDQRMNSELIDTHHKP